MKGGNTMASKKLYEKIKSYLGDKYQPSDDELINLYCETHALYKKMLKEIRKTGLLTEHTNKFGATNLVKNPLAIEATKTAQVLNTLLKSLGLTAAQRKKAVAEDVDDDDFDDL
ncbi:MAG: phage terminase small subunit P27 family [Bacilli bacterium]